MVKMTAVFSLEDMLRDKVVELEELKMATVLLGHKDALKEQLSEAKIEILSIRKDINLMRRDLEVMKEQNECFRNYAIALSEIRMKVIQMEEYLPAELIQDFTRQNQDATPVVENFTERLTVPRNNETVDSQMSQRFVNMELDTSEHCMKDCKKTLFKNPEDSYSIEPLNDEEFSKIPKYMIGRQPLATLNDFITTINAILESKYSLLALGKNGARKKGKLDLFLSLKRDEIVVAPGENPIYFFTAEDYFRHTQSKLDKTKLNLLTVLRHCKRLRELRVGKSLQYVVL